MRYRVFVGQSMGKGKEKGMSQKEQQALLKDFRSGAFNVMIATCIAEEGLDIPQARSNTLGPGKVPEGSDHSETLLWSSIF